MTADSRDATTPADSSGISFTAFYTGEVWRREGLSVPFLASRQGRLFYLASMPVEWAGRALIGTNNTVMLLQRHRIIDHLLEKAVREEGFTQIVEVACGLSPRGTRMMQRFTSRDIHYIEADLPGMAGRKRHLLEKAGELNERHRVVAIDILAKDTPDSLEAVFARELDPSRKTLVITEGLVNYFDFPTISGFWARLAKVLGGFPVGLYLTDLYPDFDWHPVARIANVFKSTLALATRSHVTLHFRNEAAIVAGFRQAGFDACNVHMAESYYGTLDIPVTRSASFVRVIENRVGPA